MADDPEVPAAEPEDPAPPDSPEGEAPSDSDQDSPEPQQPTDETAEQRRLATQQELTRKNQENADLRRQIRELENRRPGDEPDEPMSPREQELQRQVTENEWDRTELVYGTDVVQAALTAYSVAEEDPSPGGLVASYEAYHQARLKSATPAAAAQAAAAGTPTRAEAVRPRVDSNRSDVADLSQLDNDIEEAKRAGNDAGLLKGVSALLKRVPSG